MYLHTSHPRVLHMPRVCSRLTYFPIPAALLASLPEDLGIGHDQSVILQRQDNRTFKEYNLSTKITIASKIEEI